MTNTLAASTCAAMAMASLNDASETPPGTTAMYTAIITRYLAGTGVAAGTDTGLEASPGESSILVSLPPDRNGLMTNKPSNNIATINAAQTTSLAFVLLACVRALPRLACTTGCSASALSTDICRVSRGS